MDGNTLLSEKLTALREELSNDEYCEKIGCFLQKIEKIEASLSRDLSANIIEAEIQATEKRYGIRGEGIHRGAMVSDPEERIFRRRDELGKVSEVDSKLAAFEYQLNAKGLLKIVISRASGEKEILFHKKGAVSALTFKDGEVVAYSSERRSAAGVYLYRYATVESGRVVSYTEKHFFYGESGIYREEKYTVSPSFPTLKQEGYLFAHNKYGALSFATPYTVSDDGEEHPGNPVPIREGRYI